MFVAQRSPLATQRGAAADLWAQRLAYLHVLVETVEKVVEKI